jgi:hypothetical protein
LEPPGVVSVAQSEPVDEERDEVSDRERQSVDIEVPELNGAAAGSFPVTP